MDCILLTVYFEDPFWVAVFERQTGNQYQVARHVFGAEPSDPKVYQLVLHALSALDFSQPCRQERVTPAVGKNPKRRRREARRDMERSRTGTRAQEALRKEYAAGKQARHASSRQARVEAQRRKYEIRQSKRKKKHSGR